MDEVTAAVEQEATVDDRLIPVCHIWYGITIYGNSITGTARTHVIALRPCTRFAQLLAVGGLLSSGLGVKAGGVDLPVSHGDQDLVCASFGRGAGLLVIGAARVLGHDDLGILCAYRDHRAFAGLVSAAADAGKEQEQEERGG